MDFRFTDEEEAFRTEVRTFLDETLTEAFWNHQHAERKPGRWDGGWGPEYLAAIPNTIDQGSSEIQRNVITTRDLGFPRG